MSAPDDIAVTVARIDERTKALVVTVDELKAKMDESQSNYVTQAEFAPVRALAYGLVGLVLLAVVGAVLYLVVRSPDSAQAKIDDRPTTFSGAYMP